MSMAETSQSLPALVQPRKAQTVRYARLNPPIVPSTSVAGTSLMLVISIMCFLASLTAGGVYLVFQATSVWTNNISSEITVQVVQAADTTDVRMAEISKFLKDQNGVMHVSAFSKDESLKLVEPWIGKSEVLKDFAIPRLIAVSIDMSNPPDISTLKHVIEVKYPGVILDDHGLWRSEIHRLTRLVTVAGLGVILLMAAATIAIIVAAARSALASNREIVEVLNLVGAEEKFIARQFERHFFRIGILAGLIGASAAALIFFVMPFVTSTMGNSATGQAELRRLIGAGTMDIGGYIILAVMVIIVAMICKMTSRYGVRRILNQHAI